MAVTEDDTILHPDVDEDTLLYVSSLKEGSKSYERFFDALLIKRNLHRSFFRDLKSFREQPRIISLLEQANEDKKLYKEVTLVYLGSRFAHPWCRTTPLKKGFWRAEWGTIQGKQQDAEIAKEEEKLHKLLVPIWIIMRSRMFPGDEIVQEWCAQERKRLEYETKTRLTLDALKLHDEKIEKDTLQVNDAGTRAFSDSGVDREEQRRAASHAATSVLRLAAAGMILSQTPKRKLRWLTKKPQ